VGAPVQYAAPALLQSREGIQRRIRTRTSRNLAYLREMRDPASPWRVLRIEGGWYATLQAPNTKSEEERTLELLDRGVLVQPGFFFDFESEPYVVISLLTESNTFLAGLKHILNAC
jgi:alanine-synthesizing transaminase